MGEEVEDCRIARELCLICSDVVTHCRQCDALYECYLVQYVSRSMNEVLVQAFACLLCIGVDGSKSELSEW